MNNIDQKNIDKSIFEIKCTDFKDYKLIADKEIGFWKLYFKGDLSILNTGAKVITVAANTWNEHTQKQLNDLINLYPNAIFLMNDFAKFDRFANNEIIKTHKLIEVLAKPIDLELQIPKNKLIMTPFIRSNHPYRINYLIRNLLISQFSDILFILGIDKKMKIYNLISNFIDSNKEVYFLDEESALECSKIEGLNFSAVDISKQFVWA